MEKKAKQVRNIKVKGKGHSSCFERLLREWYLRESFADVILICDIPENNLDDRKSIPKISANRSVLAAASPLFAAMFRECLLEEDIRISVVGYSYNSVRSIIAYIYTGFLEFHENDKEHVEKFLGDFCITIPNKENLSESTELVEINVNASDVDKTTGNGIPIVSSVSLLSEAVQIAPIQPKTYPSNKPRERLLAPKISVPLTQTNVVSKIFTGNTQVKNVLLLRAQSGDEQNPIGIPIVSPASLLSEASQIAPIQPKTYPSNKPRERLLAPKISVPLTQPNAASQIVNIVLNLRAQSGDEQNLILQDKTANISISKNKNLKLTSEPVVTQIEQSTAPKNFIRIFNRNIDARRSRNKHILEQPMMNLTIPGLKKSSVEKSVIQSRSVFLPPTVVHVPFGNKSKSVEEIARLAQYRKIISGFNDVPGAYTSYRERNIPSIPDAPFSEPADTLVVNHIFVQSYFEKKPVCTYKERPITRVTGRLSKSNMSLSGIRIDNVHQVNGKVHICLMGELVVNKESETLFEDHPLSYLSPGQVVSRLSIEHNYSFGETPLPIDNECSNRNELATDMEDLNRAIQLVITEQRRKNRMKNRIQSYTEEINTLKRRAVKLLDLCHQMKNEAHEIDPDFRRPKKKMAIERPNSSSPSKHLEQKVPCTVCNKLMKKSWLKRHMVISHTEERNHLCDECGRTFVLKGQLRAHQQRQHNAIPGNHLCPDCGRSFRFARYLNRHMSLHSSEKPHVCRYCDKAFRLKPVLIKHIRTHTGEKPYKCTICGKCFGQRTTYATHLKVHERREKAAMLEEDRSENRGSLPRLKCDFCSMTFRFDLFLMLHRAKHTGEIPVLPCPSCTETFPSIKELTFHRKSQHPETVYACPSCPKVFMNKPNYDFHVHKHSNPDAVKKKYPKVGPVDTGPCTCDFCDKVFKSRSALDYHIKGIHLGDKPLKCQYCDKTFSHKPSMEQHMRTHTGERPYKCDQCSSAFKQQQHLTAHMVVHTGERPFSCEHCGKAFPHKTTLYAHLRIHSGKRLVCTHCRKVMPSLVQLMRHEETCPLNTNDSSID